MTEATATFSDRYTAALADHVFEPEEAALRAAYELGREAVACELTVLELAVVHHKALGSALASSPRSGWEGLTSAACDFFVESLSAFEMVQRGFREAHEAALVEQRHAAILRQLSNFLADASVGLDASASLEETLQLVVEQARELVDAGRCSARVVVGDDEPQTIEAVSEASGAAAGGGRLTAAFVGWDGREFGQIEASDKPNGAFSEVDSAVLVHLAQMASAAIERAQLQRHER